MFFTMRKTSTERNAVMDISPVMRPDRTNTSTASGEGGVQSLNRALSLLDALAEEEDGLPLTALAKKVGLPPSSAHRLLTTLQRRRFVRFEPGAMLWRVGVQAFVVGASFARSREVAPVAMPYMRQLMDKCGETVNLFVPNNGLSICIAQVQSRQVIRAISRPGGGLPLEHSASGKAMLAHLSRSEVEEIVDRRTSPDARSCSAYKLGKLHAELKRTRERGYALDDEEVAVGLRCIAAAIYDEHGAALAALSIAGPTSRLTDGRLPQLAEWVRASGQSVTREFGGAERDAQPRSPPSRRSRANASAALSGA
jgi:IclR family acetate operon transcriptional repressor